jgi:5'(3')-deoxyribonucleotidase
VTTILLDVDGVIADCNQAVWRAARKMFNRKLSHYSTWDKYAFEESMKLTRSEKEYFYKTLARRDNVGYQIGFYPGAQAFIEHLGFGHEVVFCTAPWRGLDHWVEARYNLLNHYLGRRKFSIVFTHDKHLIKGDWLIDDKWENIEKNLDRGILFEQPWNTAARTSANYTAADYVEILKFVEG